MPVINKGTSFSNGEQLTAEKLNELIDLANFNAGATDGSSTAVNSSGQIIVSDSGISTSKLATDSVETVKIKDSTSKTDGVTLPKIQHVDTAKVLGRTSAAEGNVEEVNIVIGESGDAGLLFDNDDLLDNSDTAGGSATRGATQKSVKAYVDSQGPGLKSSTASTATGTLSANSSFQDLDLSSVVGSNKAMVIMEVFDASTNGRAILFKTKGSLIEPYGVAARGSSSGILGTANQGSTIIVTTDSSGVLEYKTPAGVTTGINYAVQAFQVIS